MAAPPDWWDATNHRGFVRNIPDFYQHQPSLDDTVGSTGLINIPLPYPGTATRTSRIRWQQGGGYCGAAAMLDTMYHWNERAAYRGLIQDANIRVNGAWLDAANNNIAYNHFSGSTTSGNGMLVNAWFDTLGFGVQNAAAGGNGLLYREVLVEQRPAAGPAGNAGKVRFTSVRPIADPYIKTTADVQGGAVARRDITAIEFYRQQVVDNGYTANIRIAGTAAPDARLWWRGPAADGGNFHLVAGAGLDVNGGTRRIYIADPDSNKGSRGAESGIIGNAGTPQPGVPAVGGANPQPLIPAGPVLKVRAARKHDFANAADRPVPIPDRVVAGDGSTRELAAGFDRYYGFWDIAADGYTITDNDRDAAAGGAAADPARYRNTTIRALGITSTINVRLGAALPRVPGPDGLVNFDTTVVFTNDIVTDIDQVMFFPAQGAMSGSPGGAVPGSLLSMDPWGNPGSGLLFDLTTAPLGPDQSIALEIGTPGAPMTDFDVFFRNADSQQWTVRSTADGDVFYGLQIPSPGALGLLGLGLVVSASRRRRVTR
ncbi:MAG: hypothetical protein ACK4WH_10705 [Phycisphaerales bacterium]